MIRVASSGRVGGEEVKRGGRGKYDTKILLEWRDV